MNASKNLVYEIIFGHRGEFPVKITSWARGKYQPIPLNCHREMEFHYVKSGRGCYLIENQKFLFGKNSLIAISPGKIHRYLPQPNFYIKKTSLYFSLSLFKDNSEMLHFLKNLSRHVHLTEKDATRVEFIFNCIAEEERKKDEYWQEIVCSEIKEFIFLLKRISKIREVKPEKNTLIENLIDYIEKNFTQDLTLPILSDISQRSPSHISRLFKKYTGTGLKTHIIERRIVEAKKILEDQPQLKVHLITKKVGFHSFTIFNRNFKLITGFSPSAYRKILYHEVKK